MSFEDKQLACSDCWIIARNAERNRIITLIELIDLRGEWHDASFKQHLISLINGENK